MKIPFIVSILLIFIENSIAQQQGFFLDDWEPKTFQAPASFTESTSPEGEIGDVIMINIADTVTKVSKYVYGGNANVWSTIMHNNPTLVKNIRNLNPHVLRYPGGNLSNNFFWDLAPGTIISDVPDEIYQPPYGVRYGRNDSTESMSVDNYYQFLDSVNCEGLITVNYSYARYGMSEDPVAKAAHMAAEWVRYDNGRTRFWEIGNENFGNWQSGYIIDTTLNQDGQPRAISGDLYGQHAKVFIDSMKNAAAKIGHKIYIGVVTFEAETSWDNVQTNWNEGMIPHIGDLTDFYVIHNYYTTYQENSTAQQILGSHLRTDDFIRAVNKDITDAGFSLKPIVLNEWNIFAIGSMQQVSHINGMHASLVLGESIKHKYGCTARWDLANGWANGDDHGMFSRDGEPDVELFTPRPAFHHMTWFQRTFGDIMVKSTEPAIWDTYAVYTSTFSSGQAGIVLVNRVPEDRIIGLKFLNYDLGDRYYWYVLEGGDDNESFSRKVYINGHGPEGVAGGPDDYDSIPAFSSQITGDTIKVAMPGYSAVYMVVEGEKSVTTTSLIESTQNASSFLHIYPNPSKSSIYIDSDDFRYNKLEIYNVLGQKVYGATISDKLDTIKKIDLSLASGIYFVNLKNNSDVRIKKIIIR